MMPLSARPPGPSPVPSPPVDQPIVDAAAVEAAPAPNDVVPVGEDLAPVETLPADEEVAPVDAAATTEDVSPAANRPAEAEQHQAPELTVAAVAPPTIQPARPLNVAQLIQSAPVLRATPTARLPLTAQLGMPNSSAEVREFVRQAALDRGVDPDVAVRVVLSEGGVTPATWVGDHGSSFGPLQLHYRGLASGGNAVGGLGDAFTSETGLYASDPNTWRQQVQWALDRAARDGWGAWHGAATVGISQREGIGIGIGPTYAAPMLPGGSRSHVTVPNQFAANLSAQDAYAACGPVAAVAVARFLGRNPTVAEALQQAKQVGWTAGGGMNGIANEKRLLDAMHIATQIESPPNWRHVQADASRGTPVIVSTPNHYFVIDDYDPSTAQYHVGQSGLTYRNGAEWMSAEQIQLLGGGTNGALYIANPLAQRGADVVTVRMDAGWSMAGGGATAATAPRPATLDPGWRALDAGWSVAATGRPPIPVSPASAQPVVASIDSAAPGPAADGTGEVAPSPVQVGEPTRAERWWEDGELVRAVEPRSGPEWV